MIHHKHREHAKDNFSSSMKQHRQEHRHLQVFGSGLDGGRNSANPGTRTHTHTHAACTLDSLSHGTREASSPNPVLVLLGVHAQEAFGG